MTILEKFGVKAPNIPEVIEVYQSKEKGLLTEDTWERMDEKKHNHTTEEGNDYVVMDYATFCKFKKELNGYVSTVEAVAKKLNKNANEAINETEKADTQIAALMTEVENWKDKATRAEQKSAKALKERDNQIELNRNLIRISTERANKDRKMDKTGPGIKLLDYQDYVYRYRHEVDGDMVTQNVDLFKIRYQFPLDCSMSIDIAEDMLFSAHEKDQLGMGDALLGYRTMEETLDMIVKNTKQYNKPEKETSVITPENDELGLVSVKAKIAEKKKIKEQKKAEEQVNPFDVFDEGVIYAWSFKCNVQSGYWEVTLTTDKAPEVRMELREKYAGEKKQGGKTNS